MIDNIKKKFEELYNEKPLMIKSPGRINLIGEHTDYNEGFVLPAAIDKAIYFAITKREDDLCKLYAYDLNESYEFNLDINKKSGLNWPDYLIGVVKQLQKRNYNLKGFNCVFGGDIPIGAGLSSSAAIEAGLTFALNHFNDLNIDKLTMVQIAQKAENEFVGVNCGIMDQFINIFGEQDSVLRIDCRSFEYVQLPFNFDNISVVLFNSNVSHSLASSEYNKRRNECNEGVRIIKKKFPRINSLRDVTCIMLKDCEEMMDAITFKRCRYVVKENERMTIASECLMSGNLVLFGKMMFKTHCGLSKDYEVSCKELDFLVDSVNEIPEVFGARMMGGGFGGCTINLIQKDKVDEISKKVLAEFKNKFNKDASVYITSIGGGTAIVE